MCCGRFPRANGSRFGVGGVVPAAECGFRRACPWVPINGTGTKKTHPHLFVGLASMPNGYYVHLLFGFINGVNHTVVANADSPK